MTIIGVINGYYRQGTTVFYKLLKEGCNDCIVLYEPLHPELDRKVIKNEYEKMHKDYVWSDYKKLSSWLDIVAKFMVCREVYYMKWYKRGMIVVDPVPFEKDWDIFKEYFKMLDELDVNIILQANRLHFHLDKFKSIHVTRDIGNTFVSHLRTPRRKIFVNLICKIKPDLLIKYYNISNTAVNLFYVEDNYKKLLFENKIQYPANENIMKFYYVYEIFNEEASSRADEVVKYEEFCEDPIYYLDKIEDIFNIDIKNKENLAKIVKNKNSRCGYKISSYFNLIS